MNGELNDRERYKPLNSGLGGAVAILFRYMGNKQNARVTSPVNLSIIVFMHF